MLRLTGWHELDDARAYSDSYISLNVVWTRRPDVIVYVAVTGTNGGRVDVKLDADTGALYELVLTIDPPSCVDLRGSRRSRDIDCRRGVPTFDVQGLLGRTPSDSEDYPRADLAMPICVGSDGGERIVSFSSQSVIREFSSGSTRVAIDSEGEIVEIGVNEHSVIDGVSDMQY